MIVTKKIRIEANVHLRLQIEAKRKGTSVSDIIREAMQPYLNGEKKLKNVKGHVVETTFLCDHNDYALLEKLAEMEDLSVTKALAQIVQ